MAVSCHERLVNEVNEQAANHYYLYLHLHITSVYMDACISVCAMVHA